MSNNDTPVDPSTGQPTEPNVDEASLNDAEKAMLNTEAKDNEAKTEGQQPKESGEEEQPETKAEEPEDAPSDTKTEETVSKEEPEQSPAELAKAEARRAYQARQQKANARRDVLSKLDKAYGPASKEQLEAKGYEGVSAEVEALRQQITYSQERDRIADLNSELTSEANQVLEDYPIFNPGSATRPNPDYNPDFAAEVQELYRSSANLQTDENGIILKADKGLYEFYSRMARLYGHGNKQGEQKGKKETISMLSRSEKPPTGTATTKEDSEKEDLFLKGFGRSN